MADQDQDFPDTFPIEDPPQGFRTQGFRPQRPGIDFDSDEGISRINAAVTKILRETFKGENWVKKQRIYEELHYNPNPTHAQFDHAMNMRWFNFQKSWSWIQQGINEWGDPAWIKVEYFKMVGRNDPGFKGSSKGSGKGQPSSAHSQAGSDDHEDREPHRGPEGNPWGTMDANEVNVFELLDRQGQFPQGNAAQDDGAPEVQAAPPVQPVAQPAAQPLGLQQGFIIQDPVGAVLHGLGAPPIALPKAMPTAGNIVQPYNQIQEQEVHTGQVHDQFYAAHAQVPVVTQVQIQHVQEPVQRKIPVKACPPDKPTSASTTDPVPTFTTTTASASSSTNADTVQGVHQGPLPVGKVVRDPSQSSNKINEIHV